MKKNVLTLSARPLAEQIAAVEKGFPSDTVQLLARTIGLPKSHLIRQLKLVPRTITDREKKGEPFSPEVSERLLRVVRARQLAREIFTTDEAAAHWMSEADPSLGGRSPLAMLTTDLGAQRVERLLQAMVHGVPV